MSRKEHIWVIDDDHAIRWVLEKALQRDGMTVTSFDSAIGAIDALRQSTPPDAIVADIRMPGMSGLELLSHLRERAPDLPVIIMTAHSDLDSAVSAYQGGAFEYLPKPFDLNELSARIRSNVRRAEGAPANRLRVGDLVIDRAGAKVCRDGAEVVLTGREWAVLEALLGARGRILSRQALEDAIYAFDDHVEGNAVEVYISRLRQKLGSGIIETRRGLGYILR